MTAFPAGSGKMFSLMTMRDAKNLQNIAILCVDALSICLGLVLAFYGRIWLGNVLDLIPLGHGITMYLGRWWFVAIVIFSIAYYGGYGILVTVWDELLILSRALFTSFLIVWVVLSLQKEAETVSRIVVTLSFLLMVGLMPLLRFGTKFVLYRFLDLRKGAYLYERRKGVRRNELRDALNKEWYSGYKIIANVDRDSLTTPIDTCFVPIEFTDEDTIRSLKPNIKNMIIVSALSGLSFMNTQIRTFLGKNIALITTNNGLLTRRKTIFKRGLDIAVSLCGLILFSPFFLVIPLLIKIDSKGPVFFIHERCGISLKPFGMIKYRTMHVNGDSILNKYVTENPQALVDLKERNKITNDPRITRFGRFLRKTSLDELPQLFNVIKGEMSIIGPRPDTKAALTDFLPEYEPIYARIRPGITGLWQVSGRSDIKYRERANLDYMYLLNWSLWLDFVVLLKTFRAILGGKGAY
ncbi:MAG: UDP-N-acetylgalactosamine-undecaprenyl-phosphate N-acetylgalactosaminephosphotransferase [Syntrophorhabdus sp. PtaU1.Bin153]|nr:MAG: UDP-N-acetylgalactosamine-undecaprenyl-phosphate N-acetylgalactosaminephosphotransferase [Syntrophorhabdus sp. PtaU1.Bin153]